MRGLLPLSCMIFAIFGFASSASAQSIVDLSQPQTGKSRFVLNADMTPANLGAAADDEAKPAASASRVLGCREGCRSDQRIVDRPVAVNAYTRKDGTHVKAHTRSAPSTGGRSGRR